MTTFLNKTATPFKLAAPSWVIPGTVAENCSYLAGKVDEIALLFFETKSCLAYTKEDLPAEMMESGLSFHIHHPLDLPWHEGGAKVAQIVSALSHKAAHLDPVAHVVHPPEAGEHAASLLREFALGLHGSSIKPECVLFENIKTNSLEGLSCEIKDIGFKICLDLGHILSYAQQSVLEDESFLGLVEMLHLNAPGIGGKHECLTKLDSAGVEMLGRLFSLLAEKGTVTVELFEETAFFNSLQFLNEYCMGKK